MRYSQYFIPTVKETPADAEVISHQLMLRAGMIRKVAAGIYNYLPLGLRSLRKVENIIREEMNRAGAIEILMPSVQPAELWQESGRWEKYGKELLRFRDRKDTEFCLGPTHEEVVTDIVRREIKSYRQMPLNLYQVQGKFRDEIRPRFGLMRGREFVMKDAYSFDVDEKAADLSYDKMYQAYRRIFQRCGLKFRAVEADTGSIGGSYSHEFMVLAESGEDAIVSCNSCEYAANVEKAETRPVEAVTADALPLEKVSTPGKRTIHDVAGFLDVKPENLLKTLVFTTEDGTPVVAVLRGDHEINEIKLKNAVGCAEIVLAGEDVTEKVTGAPVGFAGPVGLKAVKIIADVAVRGMVNFFTGGNEKDLHLKNVNVDRDFSVSAFADIRNVTAGDCCPRCETGAMEEWRGIEVGHVFKLGTKYSEALRATYLDADGKEQTIFMGCYGIGVGRSVAACIEQNHDKDGIVFPLPIAPFQCIISVLNPKDEPVAQAAEEVYQELQTAGVEVLLDDRDERPGSKFKDADLIGIPIRIVVGAKSLAEGNVELKVRKSGEVQLLPKGDVAGIVRQMVTEALAGGAQ